MIIQPNLQTNPGSTLRPSEAAARKKPAALADTATEISAAQTLVTAQNITSALSPLQDAAAARAAIQNLKQNFFANTGSAMLAQANQVPENALRLLQ